VRVAVLDVGSFTARTLLADIGESGISIIRDWGAVTALGEGLSLREDLSAEAIRRTVRAAEEQLTSARAMGAEKAYGLATEAVRRAQNGARLIAEIDPLVDAVRVLETAEEGRLAFLANRAYFRRVPRLAVVDMGGGSLQIACGEEAPSAVFSLRLGVALITERFLASDPATPAETTRLKGFVRTALSEAAVPRDIFPDRMCVVLGGTMAVLAALDAGLDFFRDQAVAGYHLKSERLWAWAEELSQMTLAERTAIPLMSDRRATVVPAGVTILAVVAEWFGIPEMVYSGWGIRHGLAVELRGTLSSEPAMQGASG
jgi:exopolyphosphatase/guanosine-5'-triphosphate,3'-diphosphate pyrophosphatase